MDGEYADNLRSLRYSMPTNETELRFKTDAALLDRLKERLDVKNASQAAQTALQLLDWATKEVADGREIRSVVPNPEQDKSDHTPIIFRLI